MTPYDASDPLERSAILALGQASWRIGVKECRSNGGKLEPRTGDWRPSWPVVVGRNRAPKENAEESAGDQENRATRLRGPAGVKAIADNDYGKRLKRMRRMSLLN